MATLAEIRAKLKEQEVKSSGPVDNAIFPFWNMKEGETSVFRFLPDGDKSADFFWKERLMIKLPFAGVKGQSDSRPITVNVPCMEMYKETCPVLSEVRGWFKDPSMEDMGRKYWKKRSYIFQGLVIDSALKDETPPENPVRRVIIGPQIYQIIYSGIIDPDLEHMPTDYVNGLDFKITKTSKGSFADYSTSSWSRRERPLSASELESVETHGLHNLGDFIPKKPTEVELKVISEMFESSVDGEPYDPDRWSNYFRPSGMIATTGDPNKNDSASPTNVKPAEVKAPVVDNKVDNDDEPPFDGGKPIAQKTESAADDNAMDILAKIRSRQNAS